MYAAGAVAAYFGYKYYKKQQGNVQTPTTPTTPATTPATAPKLVPGGPTFQGASQAYRANVKILQSLLGVTADGIIGPITIKAAQGAGINYPINATNIDRVIAAVQTYKTKPAVVFPWWTKQ